MSNGCATACRGVSYAVALLNARRDLFGVVELFRLINGIGGVIDAELF